jgi:hypothetical protein
MKKALTVSAAVLLLALTLPVMMSGAAHADDSALQQLNNANDSGQAAVNSSSDEGAHAAASQTFDTPPPTPVDTTTPSEGSSDLSNAPTYNESSGSGLDNAPTNNQ